MIQHRKKDGPFVSIFDMVRRVSLKDCNKRVLESLAKGGGFDRFTNLHRAQYFAKDEKDRTLIEKALKYGQAYQQDKNSSQTSMFDMLGSDEVEIPEPVAVKTPKWSAYQKLNLEKEVVGIYITGHPLEDFKLEVDNFCDVNLRILSEHINQLPDKEFKFAAIAADALNLESRKGNKYGVLDMHDMEGSMDFRLFGEQYLKYRHFLVPGNFLFIKGNVQRKSKKWNPDGKQKEFRISYMELLSEVRKKELKQVYIQMDSSYVTNETIAEIEEVFNKYEGGVNVYLDMIDYSENEGVTLVSKTRKVEVSNEFMQDMKKIGGYAGISFNRSKMTEVIKTNQAKQVSLVNEKAIAS
jgi:DNA polymerase-3 subunit alpha